MTGNPLRGRFSASGTDRGEALAHYGLSPREARGAGGGRLARNAHAERDDEELDTLARRQAAPVQVIWQTGKYYEKEMREFLAAHPAEGIWQGAFIERMDFAYAAADAVISRSGACTVSELCLVAKPTIFVPSPNVAGGPPDQKRAMALVDKDAAMIVRDSEAVARGMAAAIELYGQRRAPATSLAKHSLARDSRLGRPHRGADREDMVIRNTPLPSEAA